MTPNPWNNTDFNEPRRTPWWSSRILLIIVLAIAVLVGLIVFWNVIVSHTDDVDESNIPVIAAETLTIKERPQQTVMEEGDSVYGLISQEKSKPSSLKTDVEDPLYETSFQQREEEEAPHLDKKEKTEEVIDMDSAEVKRAPVNYERTGRYFLQIGSLPSEHEAKQESQRLRKKHKLLKNMDIKIISKELAGKGVYYRIYAGSFESQESAEKMCKNLIQMGVNCLVAR
jgi:cell division protein FtsN